MSDMKDPPLVPGRACDGCSECCIIMTIDAPELRKLSGERCHNLLPTNRCGLYETRPNGCRTFFCGWRMLKWVKTELRPDISGVMVTLSPSDEPGRQGATDVFFTLLRHEALESEGLAESVAAAVASGAAVFIRVPGLPGHTFAVVRVDKKLRPAVRARDKEGVLHWLRTAWDGGRQAPSEEIRLSGPHTPPTSQD
jgi:hypothetical protein